MKAKELKKIFLSTVPVLSGYLVLGAGFGVLLEAKGYGILWGIIIPITMYSGSMQYVAVDLLASGASLITAAITTVMVNARHLFYGISMIERYKGMGPAKLYMIFGLTDETYSLVSHDREDMPEDIPSRRRIYFFTTLFNQIYWIIGCVLGFVMGALLPFSMEGIEFSLTALFITVFIDQWRSTKDHASAIIGAGASLACLIAFGADNFLIPAMIAITVCLTALRFARKRKAGEAK